MEVKACPHCKKTKPVSEFHRKSKGGYQSWCKMCNAEQRLQWARDNPEKHAAGNRWSRYRLRPADYQAMWENQKGLCAIGGEDLTLGTPNIDHDHSTGKVRGLLCANCNKKLGWAEAVGVINIVNYLGP